MVGCIRVPSFILLNTKHTFSQIWLFICYDENTSFLFQVDSTQVVLKENGVQLRLTVVDTPGFGDAVDNSNWYVLSSN